MRKADHFATGLDKEEEKEAREIHGKFSLYAFVLCDHRDTQFRTYVTDYFSRLDRRTDDHLLFFSLVKPDADVEYTLKKYYDKGEAMVATDYYPVDDELYQHALLEAFQVSSRDLPAIVVTPSLDSERWYVIRVADACQASQWLNTLSGIADDIAAGESVDMAEELNGSVSSTTSSGSWYEVEGVPICELVAVVEAAAAMSARGNDKATRTFVEVCERLKKDVTENGFDEERNIAIVRLIKYLEVISLRPKQCPTLNPEVDIMLRAKNHSLEPDTHRYIDIFQELCNNTRICEMGDYTVLCSLIHKVFETEINASVLQLMRKNIDIPMPEFYDKFYPGSKQCYVRNVNLNRYLKGDPVKYISPGLGSACFAYQALKEEKEGFRRDMDNYGINVFLQDKLRVLWDEICRLRNKEAHCQVISIQEYDAMLSALSEVFDHYMPSFVKMKKGLRG